MTISHYRERVMGTKIRVPSVVKSTSRVTAIVPGTSQSKNLLRFFFAYPIFHSSYEGELGVALESLQGKETSPRLAEMT